MCVQMRRFSADDTATAKTLQADQDIIVANLTQENSNLKLENSDLKDEMLDLSEELGRTVNANEATAFERDTLHQQVLALQAMKQKLTQGQQQTQEKAAEQSSEINQLNEDLLTAKDSLAAVQGNVDQQRSEITKLTEDLASAEGFLATAQGNLDEQRSEITQLTEALTTAEGALTESQLQLESVEEEKNELLELKELYLESNQDKDFMLEKKTDELKQLEIALSASEATHSHFEQTVQTLQNEKIEFLNVLRAKDEDIKTLQQTVELTQAQGEGEDQKKLVLIQELTAKLAEMEVIFLMFFVLLFSITFHYFVFVKACLT